MARSRNIKPGFFINDELAEIDPLGRLLFIGLWTIADREGRLEYRPARIKVETLPYDDCDIEKLLEDLETRSFILTYFHEGSRYIQITNFCKHQNPHRNEKESEIPAPEVVEKLPEHSGTSTGQAQEKHSTNRADSLNMIPDSLILIPDSTPGAKVEPEEPKPDDDDDQNSNSEIIKHFSQTFGYPPNQTQLEMLTSFLDDGMPEELVIEALKRTAENGGNGPKYTTAILQSWLSKKAFTLEDVEALDKLRQPGRGKLDEKFTREDFTYKEPVQDRSRFAFLDDSNGGVEGVGDG